MGLMTGYNMTKEEYEITQAVLTRLDKFESELESLLLDLEPLDLSRLDTVVREETLRMFNRIRQKSPILYRWVMNAVRYEGYRW
ncbi:hypothetical protein CUM81_04660 [Enterococcus faecalis]|uniref:hypothetical protein n=1 Tax=Enterococcus faecalis TaxID=1351 RepID=UPI000CF6788E|nr:hypothetical protein [Enterococcus faecalis]PQB47749.1 hypothetical protein CUM81_04660 [Enterococcus faecalis]